MSVYCARGSWCSQREPVVDEQGRRTGDHTGVLLEHRAPGGLCSWCARDLAWAVHDMPGDVAELAGLAVDGGAILDRPTRDAAMPKATYRERPIEYDVHCDALARLIAHETTVWAQAVQEAVAVVGEELPDQHRSSARLHTQVVQATRVLLDHWDTLLDLGPVEYRGHPGRQPHPDGCEVVDDGDSQGRPWVTRAGVSAALALAELHHRTSRAAGRGDSVTRYPDPCPWCGCRGTLTRRAPRRPGAPTVVRCDTCHQGVDDTDWDWLTSNPLDPGHYQRAAAILVATDPTRHLELTR